MINFNKFINEASKNELRVSLRHAPEAIDAYNDGRWSKMSKMKGSDVYVFKKEDDMLDFYDTLTSDWDIPEEEITMNESKIQLKRKYTEKYPAITAGKSARVRNKMLEAIADGKITQEEFDSILKEYSRDSSRWMRRNSKYFNVSEEGISLSKFGKRAFDSIKINEEDPEAKGKSSKRKVNESREETGLMVKGRTRTDNNEISDVIDDLDLYAEWNREGFWFFPEDEDTFDDLEEILQDEFAKHNIDATIEGVFESFQYRDKKNQNTKMRESRDMEPNFVIESFSAFVGGLNEKK